jgi:hypothetical protein
MGERIEETGAVMRPGSRKKDLSSTRRVLAAALLVVAIAAGVASSSGASPPSATLTVQLVPGAVSPGKPVLAVATFRDLATVTLPHVDVNVQFPAGFVVVTARSCAHVVGSAGEVACTLGDVKPGATARALVVANAPKSIPVAHNVKASFELRVGPGRPAPILTGASTTVLASNNAANRGNCTAVPKALSAVLDDQVTELVSPVAADPSLDLPCTPLSVGVSPAPPGAFKTKVASVELPKLKHPTIVKLTFANETLPDENLIDNLLPGHRPSFDNPNPLWSISPSDPNRRFVVPRCAPGPTFPRGWHSCILHVHAVDATGDDDQGWITLLVQGTGFGDPRYVG